MATININSTAAQDVIIQRVVDKVNQARALEVPPLAPLTITTYITSVLVSAFQGWKKQHDKEDLDALITAWESATTAQKNAAKAAIGA